MAYTEVRVLSVRGFDILFRSGFVFFLLCCIHYAWNRMRALQGEWLSSLLVFIFIWNTFVLCVCKTQYGSSTFEYRYHLMGIIPVMCVAGLSAADVYEKMNKTGKRMIGGCIIGVLLILNVLSWTEVLRTKRDVHTAQAVCDYAISEEVERVYLFTLDGDARGAEICRSLDVDSGRRYLSVRPQDGKTFVWNYYADYNGKEIDPEGAILITDKSDEAMERLNELFGDRYEQVMQTEEFRVFRWEGRDE